MAEINDLFEISYKISILTYSPEVIKILKENKIPFEVLKNFTYKEED